MSALKALDDEHFYYGDVLIDLPSIYYSVCQVAKSPNCDGRKSHSLGFELTYLYHVAGCLIKGDTEFLKDALVVKSIKRLNELGVKTGVVIE